MDVLAVGEEHLTYLFVKMGLFCDFMMNILLEVVVFPGVKHDVVRFDVQVDDSALVDELYSLQDLAN